MQLLVLLALLLEALDAARQPIAARRPLRAAVHRELALEIRRRKRHHVLGRLADAAAGGVRVQLEGRRAVELAALDLAAGGRERGGPEGILVAVRAGVVLGGVAEEEGGGRGDEGEDTHLLMGGFGVVVLVSVWLNSLCWVLGL